MLSLFAALLRVTPSPPQMVVLDLDGTIWRLGGLRGCEPFAPEGLHVRTARNRKMDIFASARDALRLIADEHKLPMAVASRTAHPALAKQLIKLIRIDEERTLADAITGPVVMLSCSNKRVHFRRIHEVTGIDYDDMLFFDDVGKHVSDIGAMGATAVKCPVGLNPERLQEGLRRHGRRQGDDGET